MKKEFNNDNDIDTSDLSSFVIEDAREGKTHIGRIVLLAFLVCSSLFQLFSKNVEFLTGMIQQDFFYYRMFIIYFPWSAHLSSLIVITIQYYIYIAKNGSFYYFKSENAPNQAVFFEKYQNEMKFKERFQDSFWYCLIALIFSFLVIVISIPFSEFSFHFSDASRFFFQVNS